MQILTGNKTSKKDDRTNGRLFTDLQKRYEQSKLEGEIYLWQMHIIEHPEDKECYENAIKTNLDKLKSL